MKSLDGSTWNTAKDHMTLGESEDGTVNQAGWQDIIEEHGGLVWKVAYRLLGNEADTADCFQDVFMAAVKMSQREKIRNVAALMVRLATTRAIDRLRQRSRDSRIKRMAEQSHAVHHHETPVRVAQQQELLEALRVALSRLSPAQAEAFCLKHFHNMTQKQIGQALGITANAAGVLVHRARNHLEAILTPSLDHLSEVR